MRKDAFIKSATRNVRSSLIRFISIILISFLGAGVLAGLSAVAPNMREVGSNYYNQSNVMDLYFLSSYGFDNEDLEQLGNNPNVTTAMPGYSIDLIGTINNSTYTFNVVSLYDTSSDLYLNQIDLIAGRMPQNDNEAVVVASPIGLKNVTTDTILSLNAGSNSESENFLDNFNYTIVGVVSSAYYLSFNYGNTSLGSGSIDFILYIPFTAFTSEVYTSVSVRLNDSSNYNRFSAEYKEYVDNCLPSFNSIINQRQTLIYDRNLNEINQAQAQLDEQRASADSQFDEAYQTLAASQEDYDNIQSLIRTGLQAIRTITGVEYQSIEELLSEFDQLTLLKTLKDDRDQYEVGSAEYIERDLLYQGQKDYLNITDSQADNIILLIPFLETQIELLELLNQELITAGVELSEGWETYYREYDEAYRQLNDAQSEIDAALVDLNSYGTPLWYLFSLEDDFSFTYYKENISQLERLAQVFPIVFFMVAILVCLTTMMRMVDEERIIIGTFKSLGYSDKTILARYVAYALFASLIGSLVGALVGLYLLPYSIWNAFNTVYVLPTLQPSFYFLIVFLSIISTVGIICLATVLSVRKTLSEKAAELLRNKPIASGKRIIIERIDSIWSRLSFLRKVTLRNIGLNRIRLFMTVLGIVGCCSLVITAIGSSYAIDSIIHEQFEEIMTYDLLVGFQADSDYDQLVTQMSNPNYFTRSDLIYMNYGQMYHDTNNRHGVTTITPYLSNTLSYYINLTSSVDNRSIIFNDNSVVIDQKSAIILGLSIGDQITFSFLESPEEYVLVITNITVNYTLNFLYLGSNVFEQVFGSRPEYNRYLANKVSNLTNNEISLYLEQTSSVSFISYVDEMIGTVETSIGGVEQLIIILIASAGILTYVVIYNLTNINISERTRELATLKVLGFYNRETNRYIFGEINIVNFIATLLGLISGTYLYRIVIQTLEPQILYFPRTIPFTGYLVSVAIIIFFGLLVNQVMKIKIRKINMLDSLKSNE